MSENPICTGNGRWQVHLGRRELRSNGVPVPIGARAFEILAVLVQSANELVTKTNIMNRIWPGATVGEGTLQVHISAIRKALGPDRAMLVTESGRGYRLLGSWTPLQHNPAPAPVVPPRMARPAAPPANNLPQIVEPLIGRAVALRQVQDLVAAYRVVTLTGPGGIGKTALAIEAARGLFADFDGGGWLVDLAGVAAAERVPAAVAGALGLRLRGKISAESVACAVGAKHLLLVLDNCEHVIDAAANLVERITRLCPHAAILATSRQVLRIDGEAVYRVPPLDVPAVGQPAPDRMGASAVELFVTKLNSLNADVSPRAEQLTAVAAICRHLNGIPLAIEFAAASAATPGIASVASGLTDRFALLTRGRRTAVPRHLTLRATIDWSHALLPEAERLLLHRLAIFPADFALDAAAAVMTDTGLDAASVTEGVANLVTKSLVMRARSASGSRWYLLETMRAYALEKLAESGEPRATAQRNAEYCGGFVGPNTSQQIPLPRIEDARQHGFEFPNIGAALPRVSEVVA